MNVLKNVLDKLRVCLYNLGMVFNENQQSVCYCGSVVEHRIGNAAVAGPIPASSSTINSNVKLERVKRWSFLFANNKGERLYVLFVFSGFCLSDV